MPGNALKKFDQTYDWKFYEKREQSKNRENSLAKGMWTPDHSRGSRPRTRAVSCIAHHARLYEHYKVEQKRNFPSQVQNKIFNLLFRELQTDTNNSCSEKLVFLSLSQVIDRSTQSFPIVFLLSSVQVAPTNIFMCRIETRSLPERRVVDAWVNNGVESIKYDYVATADTAKTEQSRFSTKCTNWPLH